MRLFGAALLAALVAPGAAQAAPLASFAAHELPLRGGGPVTTRARFDLVGLHWRGTGTVVFRTHAVGGRWSAWHAAAPEAEDLPNVASPESRPDAGWRIGNPWWAGASDALQVRTHGPVTRVRSYFVTSSAPEVPARPRQHGGLTADHHAPGLARRRVDPPRRARLRTESPACGDPSHGGHEHVHPGPVGGHRAGHRDLPRGGQRLERHRLQLPRRQVRAGLRGPLRRHREERRGRARGGVQHRLGRRLADRQLQLGGADLGGALAAIAKLIAWRLDLAHVDPLSTTTYISNGNAQGSRPTCPSFLRTVSGPQGHRLHRLPRHEPLLRGSRRSPTAAQATRACRRSTRRRCRGRWAGPCGSPLELSSFLPWTVTVLDPTGESVDAGTGANTSIDWTWDASLAPPGKYTYEIDAGASRPVTGVVGGAQTTPAAPLTLTASPAGAVLSPNGDGRGDSMTVKWAITATAQVHADRARPVGPRRREAARRLSAGGAATALVMARLEPARTAATPIAAHSRRGAGGAEAKASVAVLLDRTLVRPHRRDRTTCRRTVTASSTRSGSPSRSACPRT